MPPPRLPAGALLVEPRILRRVIRRHCRLSGLGLAALHGACYTLPRAELLELATPDELGTTASELADRPILLPSDTPAEWIWPRVFHALVHQALAARQLTPALVRERIHRVGEIEFDEIRFVLRQDDLLLPPRDEATTYEEFAAHYLELRRFAPAQLARTFPTVRDTEAVDALLAEDIDVEALLGASRPPGAPERPVALAPPVPGAEPRARGNLVRAAMMARRAGAAIAAAGDLRALALRLGVRDPDAWAAALQPLLEAATGHAAPARLLFDLQKAALDLEREALALDVVGWAVTLGRRPLTHPLPAAREVRHARHLAQAAATLAKVELPEESLAPLRELLVDAQHDADDAVRAVIQPRVEATLDEVGLVPKNLPERVARDKLVEELGDGVLERGFLGAGHVRDALAASQLKLADLSGIGELVRGDALLGADRRLARSLAGVYRRAEIYLRFLQKLSSLFFGTPVGRFVTRYAILPFLFAYVPLAGVAHIVGPLTHWLTGAELELFSWPLCAGLAGVAFAILHSAPVRRVAWLTLRGLGRGLALLLVDAPRALWRTGPVQAIVRSRPAHLAGRFVLKPALVAALVAGAASLFRVDRPVALAIAAAGFVLGNLALNSRPGARLEEIVADWLVRAGRHLGRRLIPGLVRLILDVFKVLLEAFDRAIYAVDELLRFHRGDGRVALVVKGVLGALWGVVTYIVRIYVNLLIEPTVNPVKHFPIVTVSGKIVASFSKVLIHRMRALLVPLLGRIPGSVVAATTVGLLPGFFGFLAWELGSNWRLYRANRPRALRPVAIGHHGESMSGLMKPGLHSGTVPKLYAKLRRAAWKGKPEAAKHREALRHVEEAIERFVDRELVALLAAAAGADLRVTVGDIEIGSNRVRVGLVRKGDQATLAFEEQSGWLVGSVAEPGWIAGLGAEDAETFHDALLGFYKLAAVDLVREQLAPLVGPTYDVADEGLVVWPGSFATEVVYRLDPERPTLEPEVRGAPPASAPPPLPADRVFFARQPITWTSWVARWSRVAAAALLLTACTTKKISGTEVTLLNASYDPTRELYEKVNPAFAAEWKARTGQTVTIHMSHGGSGKQARAVIDGLEADVVTLALAGDVDAVAHAHLVDPAWRDRLAYHGVPYTSTIVFAVRPGNPKKILNWEDVARDDVQVVAPNPKTSGGARWAYLAAWGHALRAGHGDAGQARAFVARIYSHVPVLDSGARGATTTFAERGIGDVLLTWENEALLARARLGADRIEIVVPPDSILAEPPVAVVDAVVDRHGTRAAAEAYLAFLYTPAAQEQVARSFYRPRDPDVAARHVEFPRLALFTIEEVAGDWATAQKVHFGDGGVFDSIYAPR
jgi:sulfate/thiosulfate-binding protein